MQLASLSRSLQGQWQRLRQAVVRPSATGDVSSQDATPAMSRREKAQVSLGEKIAQDRQALYDKLGQMDRNSGLRNSRQSARDKVAMLRERVRMLKAQIAGAHGATLKRLARQLAQVAAQPKPRPPWLSGWPGHPLTRRRLRQRSLAQRGWACSACWWRQRTATRLV